MLIPIPTQIKNGDKEYKAILYKYTKIHRPNDISLTGYQDGWELRILGIRVGGNVDWSLGYDELKSGIYRLVKKDFRKLVSPESKTYTLYAEFDIK